MASFRYLLAACDNWTVTLTNYPGGSDDRRHVVEALSRFRPSKLFTSSKLFGKGLALNRQLQHRFAAVALAAGIALSVAGCVTDEAATKLPSRASAPLKPETVALLQEKGMSKSSPIVVRLFKQESELEVWKPNREGRYELFKSYPICRWSGELGPKIKEGDRQAPEGFYTIVPGLMNPNSSYYLAFNTGFPNAFDRAHGRTGGDLMVHGDCSSRGCYAMTDEQIAEIYALGRESFMGGQRSFQVQAYPFRMTAENLAKHRNNPNMAFWRMLKEGNDQFLTYAPGAQGRRLREEVRVQRQSDHGRPGSIPPGRARPSRCRARSPPRPSRSGRPTTPRLPPWWPTAASPRRRSRPAPTAACTRCSWRP